MRAVPSKTGLTLRDISIGSYGEVPEHAPLRTMAPRGSDIEADVPDMGYTINDKAEVWSDNVLDLYEEAVSRQWSATRDIPWSELVPLDPDVEHAMCQLATVLSEVEMVAADFPAKWLWRINHDFVEAKMFLCTQVMDEARHTEVFRKRALANGGGLGRATAVVERFLQLILDAESYDEGSALMHLLGEGIVLSLFRAGAALAPSPGGAADLPALHAGRGPPRGLRHHAPPLPPGAGPVDGRGLPRLPRQGRGDHRHDLRHAGDRRADRHPGRRQRRGGLRSSAPRPATCCASRSSVTT